MARRVADDPTLGGACERLIYGEDDLAMLGPFAAKRLLTLTIRLRAADPYGRTPLTGG